MKNLAMWGEVDTIDPKVIDDVISKDIFRSFPPLVDAEGNVYNVNADTARKDCRGLNVKPWWP